MRIQMVMPSFKKMRQALNAICKGMFCSAYLQFVFTKGITPAFVPDRMPIQN
jgi:hypothetical protein